MNCGVNGAGVNKPGAKILAFGGYQPDRVVTNDDLAKLVDTSDEWISSRVGIIRAAVAGRRRVRRRHGRGGRGKALAASGL